MALKDIKLGVRGGGQKKMSRRNIPVKRSINLATVGDTSIDLKIAIPAIVLIILLSMLMSKFLVVDRLMAVSRAQAEVQRLQSELDASYAAVKDQDNLSDRYAHYTYSGMTQEEITRTDRVKVLQLLQKVVVPQAEVQNWSVSGNQMTLNLKRSSLQEVNLLVQQLNEHELVDYCTVTTAATSRGNMVEGASDSVQAQVLVYLKAASAEDNQTVAEEGSGDVVGDAIDAVTKTAVNGVAGNVVGDLAAGKEAVERENPKS